jgi:hypothetical protein
MGASLRSAPVCRLELIQAHPLFRSAIWPTLSGLRNVPGPRSPGIARDVSAPGRVACRLSLVFEWRVSRTQFPPARFRANV